MLPWWILLAALLGPAPPADGGPRTVAEATPVPATDAARRERARSLARGDAASREALLREAASGPAALRRAALDALADEEAGAPPEGILGAALDALGSSDPLLRGAAVRALLAVGDPAVRALEAALSGASPEGLPAVERERALDALRDLRRHRLERDFLATWGPDDGSFRGMFDGLRAYGDFGARVLTAIALDRRVAGEEMLGVGPYEWLRSPGAYRDRSEIRGRAIEALADAGNAEARGALRAAMRERPAAQLFDDLDDDPIPAEVDDALRHAVAALGDPGPLQEMIDASEDGNRGANWSNTVEWGRQASAHIRIAMGLEGEERRARLDRAEELMVRAMAWRQRVGLPVDGVHHYNLACLQARRDGPGDREGALDNLERSLRTYSVGSDWFARDGDLVHLHGEPRFWAMHRRIQEKERALRRAFGLPEKDDQAEPR